MVPPTTAAPPPVLKPAVELNVSKAPASAALGQAKDSAPKLSVQDSNQLMAYLKDLRGLNHSFQKHIQNTLAKDDFVDLSLCFESYKQQHATLKNQYQSVVGLLESENLPSQSGSSLSTAKKETIKPVAQASNTTLGATTFSKLAAPQQQQKQQEPPKPTFSIPFAQPTSATAPVTKTKTSEEPQKDPVVATPFKGLGTPQKPAETPKHGHIATSIDLTDDVNDDKVNEASVGTPTPQFPFGKTETPAAEKKETGGSHILFGQQKEGTPSTFSFFKPPSKDSPSPAFNFTQKVTEKEGVKEETSKPPVLPAFTFGQPPGKSTDEAKPTSTLSTSFGLVETAPTSKPLPTFSGFGTKPFSEGGTGSTPFPFQPPSKSEDTKKETPFSAPFSTSFNFSTTGAASSVTAPTGSGLFGSPAGATSTVGFGQSAFGAAATPKPSISSTGFTFGSMAPSFGGSAFSSSALATAHGSESKTEGDGGDDEGEEEELPKEAQIGDALLTSSAGEEGEDTRFSVRGKVHKIGEDGSWVLLGVGLFKINVNPKTSKTRLLLRNDLGNILLNVFLFPQMQPTLVGEAQVRFAAVLGPDQKLTPLMVRFKKAEDAKKCTELIQALKTGA